MTQEKEHEKMAVVADLFSSKTALQIRYDETRGKFAFHIRDQNERFKKGVVELSFEELEAIREGIKIWRETRGWENSEKFESYWNYITQSKKHFIHASERSIKYFGFYILKKNEAINNLAFTLIVKDKNTEKDTKFIIPLSPLQLFQIEQSINTYRDILYKAKVEKRTNDLMKYLEEKSNAQHQKQSQPQKQKMQTGYQPSHQPQSKENVVEEKARVKQSYRPATKPNHEKEHYDEVEYETDWQDKPEPEPTKFRQKSSCNFRR